MIGRKPDFRAVAGPCVPGLVTEILDLFSDGALSFWEWSPRQNRLVTHGVFRAESLEEWMLRIHPRDQVAFSEFLDQDWRSGPAYGTVDYRINSGAPGDWVRVRHTAGRSDRGGEDVLSGLVEELSSPQLTRTLLERVESDLRAGETKFGRFIEESIPLSSARDPAPLLESLRATFRADVVSLVHLDARFSVASQTSAAVGDESHDGEELRSPLIGILAAGGREGNPKVLELDLDEMGRGIPWWLVCPLRIDDGRVAGALCAGFRTSAARLAARRFGPLLFLASSFVAGRLGRDQEGGQRRDLLAHLRKAQRHSGLGRVTGGFAHGLKNHLTVIQGHLHLLAEAFASGDREGGLESLHQIRAASDQAAEFSSRLLNLGDSATQQLKPCNLNGIIERFVTMMRRVLEENISIRLDLDPGIPQIRADEGLLREALLNLLVNARDAMPKGGGITITTRRAEGTDGVAGSFVSLRILDDGPGKRGRCLPSHPDPFALDGTDTTGSGLELYHVASIVAEHGGQVVPTLGEGRGNVFHLLLPAAERELESPALPAETAAPGSGGPDEEILRGSTVLLVEDEVAVRKLVRKLLEMLGCTVVEAASGRQALGLWPEIHQQVSLVVSDIVMPEGVSGWDLARDLHRRHPELGILLTSGYSETPADHGLGQIPQIEFLQKPYRVNDLKRLLLRLAAPVPA